MSNNRPEKDKEQTTLIEVDSEFWQTMRELIRAELSRFVVRGKKKEWDRSPKPPEFWSQAEARIRRLIAKYHYVNYQICIEHEAWFTEEGFATSSQILRLYNTLVKSGEFEKFRISPGSKSPWYLTLREYKELAVKKAKSDYHRKTVARRKRK